jgi:hypothetical protein
MEYNLIKAYGLVLSGVLTPIMTLFVPIGGGGASLIFILSMPILNFLGILSGIGYWHVSQKESVRNMHNTVFILLFILMVGLALYLYPYKN